MYAKIPIKNITKIKLLTTNCKKTVAQVKAEQKCQYVINGTLYNYNTLAPCCKYRTDGKTITNDEFGYWGYGFNSGPDIQMDHSKNMDKYKNFFAVSAMLKDGSKVSLSYNKDQGGTRGRSAIGLDGENLILFCSKDGTSYAQTPERLVTTMLNLGCKSAIMLDSGTSSSCDFNGKTVTTTRKVANYICIWTSTSATSPSTSSCPYSEPSVLIKSGSSGDGAKWVQWHLNHIMNSGLTIDGAFGNKSVIALKTFQAKYGLTVDGMCGAATRTKMKSLV